MSLYGALFSGVSGLSAQSSAMGAIADNVTNVNTIGYKSTQVQFQTLVTAQVSLTKYSAGGVQSKPRQGVDVQGLLQSSSSSTDIAISGQGFFVVSDQANADTGSLFGYTRAGSFKVDKDGYMQNTAGWYLQGWPLQPAGQDTTGYVTVTSGGDDYVKAYNDGDGSTVAIDDNIVTSEDLQPLNLNTIGGTAQETKNVNFGANLPSGAEVGDEHKSNLLIYDTLGNSHQLTTYFNKTDANSWSLGLSIPPGAATLELQGDTEIGDGEGVYAAYGQIEFESLPADGDTITIDGITFEFDTGPADLFSLDASTIAAGPGITIASPGTGDTIVGDAGDFSNFTAGDTITLTGSNTAANDATYTITAVSADGATLTFADGVFNTAEVDAVTVLSTSETQLLRRIDISSTTDSSDVADILETEIGESNLSEHSRFVASDGTILITQSNQGAAIALDVSGTDAITQRNANGETGVFTVAAIDPNYTTGGRFDFAAVPADGETIEIDGITFEFDTQNESVDSATSAITYYADINTYDGTATAGEDGLVAAAGDFDGLSAGDTVHIADMDGLTDGTFTIADVASDGSWISFADTTLSGTTTIVNAASDADMVVTLFNPTVPGESSTRRRIDISGTNPTLEAVTTALKTSIDASALDQTSRFSADGTSLTIDQSSNGDAVVIGYDSNTSGSGAISGYYSNANTATDFTDDSLDTLTDGGATATISTSSYGSKKAGLAFNGDGTPEYINTNNIDIQWANGAEDQESGSSDDTRIGVFLGNQNVSDGMTQFAGSFQINYVSQNGAAFGNFAGVSIGSDGVVTALFDNGVTRPVFMIPVATFVNPNQMSNLTGNVWIETDFSGQPTVREAQEGGAGEMAGGSLESSTVDLGEEFTSMITTQRAYSAAAKIISTADEMLEELMRVKR